jgi:hypothetical protein
MPELTRPIIVCGVARSGTTFVQDLLDAHPEIGVSDEFFLYRMPAVQALFGELAATVAERVGPENWPQRKAQLMRALWFQASRQPRLEKGLTSRRFANKTPGAEHYLDFYDDVFSGAPPLWIYMLREGRQVFVSRKNMRWGKIPTIRQQVRRYLDSLALIEAYRQRNPERVLVFQLDRIEATPAARRAAVDRLFAYVQEQVVDEVADFVERWRPVQTSVQHHARTGPGEILTELPPDEQKFLGRHRDYQSAMQRYGY